MVYKQLFNNTLDANNNNRNSGILNKRLLLQHYTPVHRIQSAGYFCSDNEICLRQLCRLFFVANTYPELLGHKFALIVIFHIASSDIICFGKIYAAERENITTYICGRLCAFISASKQASSGYSTRKPVICIILRAE